VLGRHGELHAVLPGVAGAGHHAGRAEHVDGGDPEATDGGGLGATVAAGDGRQALDGEHGTGAGDVGAADGGEHPLGVGGVGHDVEALVTHPPDDDVVEHRPRLVEEVRVLGAPGPIFERSLVRTPAGRRTRRRPRPARCRGG
jgi:hypothetical protein